MIGQIVLLRLENQYTLAAIAVERSPDDVDLRAFSMRSDGTLGDVLISGAQRGDGTHQWTDLPWPIAVPELASVAERLMPAEPLGLPPMPLMVILRY